MAKMDSNKLTKIVEDEELGVPLGAGTDAEGVEPVGPDVGAGVQSAGVPEVGEGMVGVVVGEGAGKGEPEVAETVMANFWPS